jgi:hypothetical protein
VYHWREPRAASLSVNPTPGESGIQLAGKPRIREPSQKRKEPQSELASEFHARIEQCKLLDKQANDARAKALSDRPETKAFRRYANGLITPFAVDTPRRQALYQAMGDNPDLQEAYRTLLIAAHLNKAISSTDKIEDTTVGALVNDLVVNTDYFDGLRRLFETIEAKYFGKITPTESLHAISTPNELLEELPNLAERHSAAFRVMLDKATSENATAYAYALDEGYAFAMRTMAGAYEESWTQEANRLRGDFERAYVDLWQAFNALPVGSAERNLVAVQIQELDSFFRKPK